MAPRAQQKKKQAACMSTKIPVLKKEGYRGKQLVAVALKYCRPAPRRRK
jgi:hypothetical protein